MVLLTAAAFFVQSYASDTKSVDSTVKAVYSVISGAAGEKRDWARFRNLFAEGAVMNAKYKRDGKLSIFRLTPEDYVKNSGPWLETNGFFETEVGRKTDTYGSIAHVFSTYESRKTAGDKEPFERGINSIQLSFDGTRWWVVSILWTDVTTDGPVPKQYLKR